MNERWFDNSKGIEYFLEHGFIDERSPQAIAAFLHQTEGLSKAMMGEYMGEVFVSLVKLLYCLLTHQ
jgi:brefeldin A-inhibited guanine nucleotide-exchange protein